MNDVKKRPNNLTDNEINDILINYQSYFKKRLKEYLPKKFDLPFRFTFDDFLQEVLIKMWTTLRDKYDPQKGTINTFIVSHINTIIRYVILNVSKSLFYTGKDLNDNKRRTQSRELQKNCMSLDNMKVRGFKFPDEVHSSHDINSFLYHVGVESEFNEEWMDWSLDFESILKEIRYKLSDDLYDIFLLYFMEDLSQKEISNITKVQQGTISKKLTKIKNEIRIILKDMGY